MQRQRVEESPQPSVTVRSNQLPVTVIVPVRNEARNLPRCLDSLAEVSEVIVVDSQSTGRQFLDLRGAYLKKGAREYREAEYRTGEPPLPTRIEQLHCASLKRLARPESNTGLRAEAAASRCQKGNTRWLVTQKLIATVFLYLLYFRNVSRHLD